MKAHDIFVSWKHLLIQATALVIMTDFSIWEDSSFFWSFARDVSLYGTSFLFLELLYKIMQYLVFQIHFLKKIPTIKWQQFCYMWYPAVLPRSFYFYWGKIVFSISPESYEKDIVSEDYYNAHHRDKMCFLLNSSYHTMLMRDNEELLQKRMQYASHINA